jgi:hypothetical protein
MMIQTRMGEAMWQDLDVVAVRRSTASVSRLLRASVLALMLLGAVVAVALGQESVGRTGAAAGACDDPATPPGARLHGRVQDEQTDVRIPGVRVLVSVPREGNAIRRDTLEVATDERGEYEICGLPVAASVRLWSRYEEHRNQSETVRLDRETRRDMSISLGTPASVLFGFTGADGEPLAGATVRLEPFEVEEETDRDGRVWLPELIPDRYLLTVLEDDRETASIEIEIEGGDEVEFLVRVVAGAGNGDALRVQRSNHDPVLAQVGYYDRSEGDRGGYFVTGEELAATNHLSLADVFTFQSEISTRYGRNPIGYLDGRLVTFLYPNVSTFLREYRMDRIRAMEVHRCSEAPAQYRRHVRRFSDCSIFLIWSEG